MLRCGWSRRGAEGYDSVKWVAIITMTALSSFSFYLSFRYPLPLVWFLLRRGFLFAVTPFTWLTTNGWLWELHLESRWAHPSLIPLPSPTSQLFSLVQSFSIFLLVPVFAFTILPPSQWSTWLNYTDTWFLTKLSPLYYKSKVLLCPVLHNKK